MDRLTHSLSICGEACPSPPGDGIDCDGYQLIRLLDFPGWSDKAKRPLRNLEDTDWLYHPPEFAKGGSL